MIIKPPLKDDHRWFIWAIVFLIISGVSLTSYIMITDIQIETENTISAYIPPLKVNQPSE